MLPTVAGEAALVVVHLPDKAEIAMAASLSAERSYNRLNGTFSVRYGPFQLLFEPRPTG